jgi:hypothetical protein
VDSVQELSDSGVLGASWSARMQGRGGAVMHVRCHALLRGLRSCCGGARFGGGEGERERGGRSWQDCLGDPSSLVSIV